MTPLRAAPEADATRDLYERYARQIHAYCMHQLGNREEAEDAVQSTFLNAFRGLRRGVDPEFETAWLYKIAENVCLTRQRSSSRRRRIESPGDLDAMQDFLPAHQADSDELIRLPEALEEMPEQQRRALLLREWQGLSYKEISAELGLSQAAVETLLFRARRSLASALTDEPKEKKAGVAKKLRAGGDAGSVLALLKTLIFAGGAKVAATVAAVAVTSVVAATPAVRHSLEQAVAPSHSQPAKPHAVASKVIAPTWVATPRSSVGAKLVAPASHQTRRPTRNANAAGNSGAPLPVGHAPLAPVEGTNVAPAAPAPTPAAAPAVEAPVAAAAPAAPSPTQAEAPRDAGPSGTSPGTGSSSSAPSGTAPSGTAPSQVKDEGKKSDPVLTPVAAPDVSSPAQSTSDAKAAKDAAKAERKDVRNVSSASPSAAGPTTAPPTTSTTPTTTGNTTTTTTVPVAAVPAVPPGQAKKNDLATTPDPAPTSPSPTVAAAAPTPQPTPTAAADNSSKSDHGNRNGHRK